MSALDLANKKGTPTRPIPNVSTSGSAAAARLPRLEASPPLASTSGPTPASCSMSTARTLATLTQVPRCGQPPTRDSIFRSRGGGSRRKGVTVNLWVSSCIRVNSMRAKATECPRHWSFDGISLMMAFGLKSLSFPLLYVMPN